MPSTPLPAQPVAAPVNASPSMPGLMGKSWASRGRTLGRVGSSGMKRRGRAHLPRVRGTPAGPRPWFGSAYGMAPWGLGPPAPSSMRSVKTVGLVIGGIAAVALAVVVLIAR